jgi:hypothetical protein
MMRGLLSLASTACSLTYVLASEPSPAWVTAALFLLVLACMSE